MMKGALVLWIQVLTIFVYVYCVEKDLVFVIDSTHSINASEFYHAINFTYDVTKFLQVGPNQFHISVVVYNNGVKGLFDFAKYTDQGLLLSAISNITYEGGGSTNTENALDYAGNLFRTQNGSRANAGKAVVVITDGNFHDPVGVKNAAKRLHNNSITIYGVALERPDYIASDMEYLLSKEFSASAYKYACNLVPKLVFDLDPNAYSSIPPNCPPDPIYTETEPHKAETNIGVIAGTTSALLLLLLCLLLFLLLRKKLRNKKTPSVYPENNDIIVGLPPQKTFIR